MMHSPTIPLQPVNTTLPYTKPFFRNDDVAVDSNLAHFRQFCALFHAQGFTQVHGIMLRGLGNVEHMADGVAVTYAGQGSISQLPNARIRELSKPYRIKDNAALVDFLNSMPDELALHGLYHTDYSAMSYDEQLTDMREGLAEMTRLFPHKSVRYFIAPFNRHNDDTHRAAQEVCLRVLYDDGVHLEAELDRLVLEPGVWYRYHHHRFYPESRYTQHPPLSLGSLQKALADGVAGKSQGSLPTPAEEIDIDVEQYAALAEKHGAQPWYLNTALGRRHRHELQIMSQWVVAHMTRDKNIFELCCGGGSNLLWLTQHGFTQVRGSDYAAKAVALTNDYMTTHGMPAPAYQADYLDTRHVPRNIDVLWASNCLYLIPDFSLSTFLKTLCPHVSAGGCFIFDLVDARFNNYPNNRWHSADWDKPEPERRPSEYRHRFQLEEVKTAALAAGLHLVIAIKLEQGIPRTVFVLARPGVTFTPRMLENPHSTSLLRILPQIKASGLFDRQWYINQYVRGPLIMEPLEHYIRFGAGKGYNPNAHFDTLRYKEQHMQPGDATNPLFHYILNAMS